MNFKTSKDSYLGGIGGREGAGKYVINNCRIIVSKIVINTIKYF